MRISEISATDLFGVFNHKIKMKESRITIIHGPNGVGKTVLFRMVHGLFNRSFQVFTEIPFREFKVTFDTNEAVFVRRNSNGSHYPLNEQSDFTESIDPDEKTSPPTITMTYFDGIREHSTTYLPEHSTEDDRRALYRHISRSTALERVDEELWLNPADGTFMTMGDIVENFSNVADRYWKQEPNWFKTITKTVHTRFIQTQRLQQRTVLPSRSPYRFMRTNDASVTPNLTVERYSRNIVQEIQRISTKYAEESQKIDRVFPKNLIEEWRRLRDGDANPKYEQDELKTKLTTLDKKRKTLMTLGLFEGHEAPTLVDVDEDLAGVFSIYVDDVQNKFSVFDEISKQLQILTDFVNARFQYKRLTIDKQRGFVLIPIDKEGNPQPDQRVPTASLSSGEQHQLVLFYELLFDVKANSLILIDEPEISLHVDWQDSFLEDLERASQVGDFDVLMATHSPDIIGDKGDDWTVGLGNPESV